MSYFLVQTLLSVLVTFCCPLMWQFVYWSGNIPELSALTHWRSCWVLMTRGIDGAAAALDLLSCTSRYEVIQQISRLGQSDQDGSVMSRRWMMSARSVVMWVWIWRSRRGPKLSRDIRPRLRFLSPSVQVRGRKYTTVIKGADLDLRLAYIQRDGAFASTPSVSSWKPQPDGPVWTRSRDPWHQLFGLRMTRNKLFPQARWDPGNPHPSGSFGLACPWDQLVDPTREVVPNSEAPDQKNWTNQVIWFTNKHLVHLGLGSSSHACSGLLDDWQQVPADFLQLILEDIKWCFHSDIINDRSV